MTAEEPVLRRRGVGEKEQTMKENAINVRDLAHVLGVEDLALTVAHREGTWSATVRYQGHPLSGCSEAWCDDDDLERAIVGAIENWRAFVAAEIAEMEEAQITHLGQLIVPKEAT